LPTVSLVYIVTQWSGSGGTEAYLSGQLASFSALTLLVGSSAEMTYKVSSGTLNLCSINHPAKQCVSPCTVVEVAGTLWHSPELGRTRRSPLNAQRVWKQCLQ